MGTAEAEFQRALTALASFGAPRAVKLYRVSPDVPLRLPTLPCLDHEAMLHQRIAPHAAMYIEERTTGDLHELVLVPAERRIEIDTTSTAGEHTAESHDRLQSAIAAGLPEYTLHVTRPSWWRGDERVSAACRAQVPLRAVLLGQDLSSVKAGIARLQTISSLMEKQSRVASWGVRTATGPVVAAAGVLAYLFLGTFAGRLGDTVVLQARYGLVTLTGGLLLYYGMKAVQLTRMANMVWKRATEYALIMSERQRLAEPAASDRA